MEAPLATKLKVLSLCIERIEKAFNSLTKKSDDPDLGGRLEALGMNDWLSESSQQIDVLKNAADRFQNELTALALKIDSENGMDLVIDLLKNNMSAYIANATLLKAETETLVDLLCWCSMKKRALKLAHGMAALVSNLLSSDEGVVEQFVRTRLALTTNVSGSAEHSVLKRFVRLFEYGEARMQEMQPSERVSHQQLMDLKGLLNKILNDVVELDSINDCHIKIDSFLNNPQDAVKRMSERILRSEEAFQERTASVGGYMSSCPGRGETDAQFEMEISHIWSDAAV